MQSRILKLSDIDLNDRLTVEHYISTDFQLIQQVSQSPYPLVPLGKIAVVKGGKRLPPKAQYSVTGIPYIRVVDIGDFEVDLSNVVYISQELHNRIKRYQLKQNDISIVIVGATIGKTAIFKSSVSPCNFNENLARITARDTTLNPEYLLAYLQSRFGQSYIRWLTGGAAQAKLSLERIEKIEIPIPPRPIQDRIAKLIQNAYKAFFINKHQANKLLSEIDTIVCQSLKIQVGEILDHPRFLIPAFKLENRLDFKFYDRRYVSIIESIERGFYPVVNLGSQCREEPRRGTQPQYFTNGSVVVLKTINVGAGEIYFNNALRTNRNFLESRSGSLAQLRKSDLVITSTGNGSWGRASVFNAEMDCIVDGHITIVRLKPEHNPYFFELFLNSSLGQAQFWQRYRGHTGQTEVYPDDISALKVTVPPRQVQEEIVRLVSYRRDEAKRLRIEAEVIVAQAKALVEKMLLAQEDVA